MSLKMSVEKKEVKEVMRLGQEQAGYKAHFRYLS
jgi:hypothetical protein